MKIQLIGATGQHDRDLIRNDPTYDIIAPTRDVPGLARSLGMAKNAKDCRRRASPIFLPYAWLSTGIYHLANEAEHSWILPPGVEASR